MGVGKFRQIDGKMERIDGGGGEKTDGGRDREGRREGGKRKQAR